MATLGHLLKSLARPGFVIACVLVLQEKETARNSQADPGEDAESGSTASVGLSTCTPTPQRE